MGTHISRDDEESIQRIAAAAQPPSPELVEFLSGILGPTHQRLVERRRREPTRMTDEAAPARPPLEKLTYTLAEVAEMTGFSVTGIQEDCRLGRVTHVRRGHFVGMTREQIDALIAAHTVGATEKPPTDEEIEAAAIERRMARIDASAAEKTAQDNDRRRALARIHGWRR